MVLSFQKVIKYVEQLLSLSLPKGAPRKYLKLIEKMIKGLVKQPALKKIIYKLNFFQKTFDELRNLLELRRNDTSSKVKDRVLLYINRLTSIFCYFPELEKIKIRLENYWDFLFHAYDIHGLPRVNNGAENFNLLLKRINRKWTGRRDNWMFIEHYGPSLAFLPNFIPKNENDPHSPLEKLNVFSSQEINNLFMNVSKMDMKLINQSIELKTKEHKINLKIFNKGIDWFLKDIAKMWLEANKNVNGGN